VSKSPKELVLTRLDELGFERIDSKIRHEGSWSAFVQNNAFYAVKYIKDRSANGMMHILAGGKWRWQIRLGQQYAGNHNFTLALWDAKEGVRYSKMYSYQSPQKIDTGTPVFMMRTIKPEDDYLSVIEKHIATFEEYALDNKNHCPKCGDMLVPRKAKKLRVEEPYALARATRGKGSLPKQRTYLACNDWPSCTYIQSYLKKGENETV